jgi:hypothetical protein
MYKLVLVQAQMLWLLLMLSMVESTKLLVTILSSRYNAIQLLFLADATLATANDV